jgi:hypothetical protein
MMTEENKNEGLFHYSQAEKFFEEKYISPEYVYHFVRTPISRMGFLFGIHKVNEVETSPTVQDIHTFLTDLFVKALLSAECSIGWFTYYISLSQGTLYEYVWFVVLKIL